MPSSQKLNDGWNDDITIKVVILSGPWTIYVQVDKVLSTKDERGMLF